MQNSFEKYWSLFDWTHFRRHRVHLVRLLQDEDVFRSGQIF